MSNANPAPHDRQPPGYAALGISRSRGLIWVCDISKSSTYLNSDEMASSLTN